MGYYGHSMYRGDYRTRARGDWLDDVGGAIGKVGGYISKVEGAIPIVGKIVNAYNTSFGKTIAAPTMPAHPALGAPGLAVNLPPLGTQMVAQRGVRGGTPNNTPAQRREDRHDRGGYRRMNPCNPKALRRAMRRTSAFMGFAKKYVKLVHPKVHVEMRHHPLKHHKKG